MVGGGRTARAGSNQLREATAVCSGRASRVTVTVTMSIMKATNRTGAWMGVDVAAGSSLLCQGLAAVRFLTCS